MTMSKIKTLKQGDVIVSDDWGIGGVYNIWNSMISVSFINMVGTNWTYNISICENLEWYNDNNCSLADEKEYQIFEDYSRKCEELMREADEECDPPFSDESEWEYSVDGVIIDEVDYLLDDDGNFARIAEFRGYKKNLRCLLTFTDIDDPSKVSTSLVDMEWIREHCVFLPKEKAQPYLDRINDYAASLDCVCGADDYYNATLCDDYYYDCYDDCDYDEDPSDDTDT